MTTSRPQVLDTSAARRANAYFALARALDPPRVWGAELPELLVDALGRFAEPLPQLGNRLAGLAADSLNDREPLAVAHARLLIGPFEILAAPWASFYLEEEPQLMGAVSQYAAAAYANAGLGPGEKQKDAPDHLTHELEFMYFLAFNEATDSESVWSQRQERFWQEHLGRWLPKFAEVVASGKVHPFYTVLAEALGAFAVLEGEEWALSS